MTSGTVTVRLSGREEVLATDETQIKTKDKHTRFHVSSLAVVHNRLFLICVSSVFHLWLTNFFLVFFIISLNPD
jgi:hypothetical protein